MFNDVDDNQKSKTISIEDYEKPMNPLDPKNNIKPIYTYFYLVYQHMIKIPSWITHILMVTSLYMIWLMLEAHREQDDWIVAFFKPINTRRQFLWTMTFLNLAIVLHCYLCYTHRQTALARTKII